MIKSSETATRVQGGWQLFNQSGETIKFIGRYFSYEPKNQNPVAIKTAHIAMQVSNASTERKLSAIGRRPE